MTMTHSISLDTGSLPATLAKCLGCAAAVGLAFFFYRLYQVRMMVRRAQRDHGVPLMPHSFLFGHLIVAAKLHIKYKLPRQLHGHWMFSIMQEEYPDIAKCGVLYFDTWPISFPLIAVINPAMAAQFTISPSLPKFHWQRDGEFRQFSGGVDMVTSEGHIWKEQRAIYNPGFSSRNITSMAPWFLEEILVFKDRMLKAADSGETIKLESYCMDLTLDVIARATLDMRTRAQENQEPSWLDALREQIKLLYFNLEPSKQLNPMVSYKHWKYNRILKAAITTLIENAYANYTAPEGPKTIIELAVKQFAEKGQPIPADYLAKAVSNIKMFLFAGHETTSTTIALMYYMLSRNPDQLAALRAEHDAVFGPDPSQAITTIKEDYTILNKLVYTSAVVKELLRISPPVGGPIRESSSPDFMLTNPETGARFPTYGFMMHASAVCMGNDPKYWPEPEKFLPERFLVRDEKDPLYPVKHAWMPFSLGPRACIGQEMVQLEVRLVLALTIREIDIVPDYPKGAETFKGMEAFQVSTPEAVPSARIQDALPVKVKRRVI
ncbi:cytochrome P450 [Xylariales sp. PMI_506]|nr:cytochrome P450 [Xylariales sp. PMI_506]